MSRLLPSVRDVAVLRPSSLTEAVQALAEVGGEATILAGGTDLMVRLDSGAWRPSGIVLDISGIQGLRQIAEYGDQVRIGALTTFADIARSSVLAHEAPSLVAAAKTIGAIQIQNRATIGGNLMNASPAGDSMPTLLALGASVTLLSSEGERVIPFYSFHVGYRRTVAKPGELLTAVTIPRRPEGAIDWFRKVGARQAQTISKVVFAGRIDGMRTSEGRPRIVDLRLGIGSVAATPLRLFETERRLKGGILDAESVRGAAHVLRSEIAPIDDRRSTEIYRRTVAGNLLIEFLTAVLRDRAARAT